MTKPEEHKLNQVYKKCPKCLPGTIMFQVPTEKKGARWQCNWCEYTLYVVRDWIE